MELSPPRLLVFNCHEAWVHQLGYLDYDLDIVDGLPGRYCSRWDTGVRPVPGAARLVNLKEVVEDENSYHCLIAHNITDLLDLKRIPGPRILVFHNTLESLSRQHGLDMDPEKLKDLIQKYLGKAGGHSLAISPLKLRSWGGAADVVRNGVDVHQYLAWSGEVPAGLRVSNQISNRRETLLWDFHEESFRGLPVRLVGFNPDMPGVEPSRDWNDLKGILASHRFYIHTAHPELEDGYNMATLEAMAAGLPVLGNRHPSSPVEHGISGFLSDDPGELHRYAELLIENRELAGRMGEAARKRVIELFSIQGFVKGFKASIEKAREKWMERKIPVTPFSQGIQDQEAELQLVIKSGRIRHLCESFRDRMNSLDVEEGILILDEIVKLLSLSGGMTLTSLEDLGRIVIGVSERLIKLKDSRSAELLSSTLLRFIGSTPA